MIIIYLVIGAIDGFQSLQHVIVALTILDNMLEVVVPDLLLLLARHSFFIACLFRILISLCTLALFFERFQTVMEAQSLEQLAYEVLFLCFK